MDLFLVFVSCTLLCCNVFAFPANEYEFSIRRDSLKDAERIFEGKITNLTQNEQIVDHYLQHLKWLEFKRTEDIGFPPARPIEEEMDYIRTTDVYRVLKKLPKGGNMHTHENHELSKRTFLDLIFDSDQLQYLYMVEPGYENEWTLDFFTFPPENQGWIHVNSSNYTRDDIYQHQVLTEVLDKTAKRYPSDSAERWRQMDPLWGRMASVVANLPIKLLYLEALYNASLEQNIQYIEARKNFEEPEYLYVMEEGDEYNDTNGKRFLENDGGALEINITLAFLEDYMQRHPEFIGHKRITYTVRVTEPEVVNASIQNALNLHRKYPDHLVGFDLVAQEDAGNSHLFYLRPILSLYDESTDQSEMPLWLHTAETNYPDDLITSENDLDPVSTIQNAYEAILYGARRVGHGLGFIKHPYLLNILRERQVAVEACPVSNQLLGFTPDIRNHPAIHYFRSGVPVVLGSDDSGTFGYDDFTIDWYEVFMAWGLDLAEMKQLAMNSILFSSMSDEEKQEALTGKWQTAWDLFIDITKKEACSADFADYEPLIGMVLPKEGANSGTTPVHIYGRNFTRAICGELKCKFGEIESPRALYISNNHIICEAPDISQYIKNQKAKAFEDGNHIQAVIQLEAISQALISHTTVPIMVDFGDGNYTDIGKNFTYKYEALVDDNGNVSGGDAVVNCHVCTMMIILLLVTCIFTSK